MVACSQYWVWNTFGPIVTSVHYAYGWTEVSFAWMPNWGTLTFVIFIIPFSYLLERFGLRFMIVLITILIQIGAVFRIISNDDYYFLVFAHTGSILNGIAGATVMSAPPVLSSIWFPPEQRILATSIGQVFTQVGTGLSFSIGPHMLARNENITKIGIDRVKLDIQKYLIIVSSCVTVVLILVVMTFCSKPPTPPSGTIHK